MLKNSGSVSCGGKIKRIIALIRSPRGVNKFIELCILGIAAGLLFGIWMEISKRLYLIPWAGFAGCITYFAWHERGWRAVGKVVMCNFSGIACAMLLLYLALAVPFMASDGIWYGFITMLMCLLGYIRRASVIPGILIGYFSVLAAYGVWLLLAISMACGSVLGNLCYILGTKSYEFLVKKGILQEPVLKNDKEL